MYGPGKARRFTATNDVTTDDRQVEVKGFTVSPGTATTTILIKEGGTGGTILFSLVFPANAAAVAFPVFFFVSKLHVTITGAAAEVTFIL